MNERYYIEVEMTIELEKLIEKLQGYGTKFITIKKVEA